MTTNPLGIKRFGPLCLCVEDAEQEARRLAHMLCMDIAYVPAGNEAIFGLQSGDAIFIVDGSEKARRRAAKHSPHVQSIGLIVRDAEATLAEVQRRSKQPSGSCEHTGASYLQAPHDGDLLFRFVEDSQLPYPGIKRNEALDLGKSELAFERIDHIVTNTQAIAPMIRFLGDVFGMQKVNEFTIQVQTESFVASLYSEVMGLVADEGEILFPINEPLPGDSESQIPAQLRSMGRSHVQHIALATSHILSSIQVLRDHGLGFLEFRNHEHAQAYYADVPRRLGKVRVAEAMQFLRELGILVDKCGEGYLLQLFSKRLFAKESVPFVEIIQRASDVIGCFGDGNFAALAESLEHAMRQAGEKNE